MDLKISGTTAVYGVIGKPISHSGSPKMYNFCFNHYGIDAVYLAFLCDEDEVEQTLSAFKRLGFKGGNVTMPCKQMVARCVDKLEGAAAYIGAVNTIVNNDGMLTGYITDGAGVVLDLADHGVDVVGKDIVLLGAGGAATAIFVQLILDGAKSVHVFNRSEAGLEKLRGIADKCLPPQGGVPRSGEGGVLSTKVSFGVITPQAFTDSPKPLRPAGTSPKRGGHEEQGDSLTAAIRSADILINATSVGMRGVAEGESVVTDMSAFHEDLVIYDCIYNPLETKLMADARANKVPDKNIIGGSGMLMWQGSKAFELFTGKKMPVEELKEYLSR